MNKQEIVNKISKYIKENSYYDIEIDGLEITEFDTLGGKGDGAEMSIIYKVKSKESKDFLVRIDGYYSSWDSSQFDDDAYEVVEYEKIVKDYKKVK